MSRGTAAPRRVGKGGGILLASLALCLAGFSAGCGFYSFTGAVVPTHLETIAVPLAEDRSLGAPPGLDQQLTDLLIARFVGRTRLSLVPDEADADVVLFAEIERYENQPAAVTGQDVAALNRVSISVRIRYVDRVEERDRLARAFSAVNEYDATRVDLEATAALNALQQVAEDAFNAATSDW